MKKVLFILLLLTMGIIFTQCNSQKKADLLIHNAKVYTVDSANSIADAIAIKSGKIIAVNTHENLKSEFIFEQTINVNGKYIYPGLIDAHCHIYGYALSLRQANLRNTKSFDEVLQIIQNHKLKYPEAYWITGRGWDQNDWQIKEFPDRKVLDELFPDNPVVLTRVDGHAALINKKAMEIVGFTNTTEIKGGDLIKKEGHLTGIVLDKACDSIRNCVSEPEIEELKQLLIKAQNNCLAVGLTTVADAGLDKKIIEIIDSMHKQHQLKINIYAMLNPTEENFKTYIEKGVYKTERLHLQSVKLYADGALGSRGAALLEPYSDDMANYGLMIEPIDYYHEIAKKVKEYGYQLNTHAIGDSAARIMLDVYSKYLQGKNDLRWRIEHSQVVHPDDIGKFGEYYIIPAINTTHATSDMGWAGKRLGDTRIKYAYAYKNLLQQNGWLCNGSDFPIEDIDPMLGFYAGISRKDLEGNPKEGFQKENALNRNEALKAMTIWAAKACFEEDIKGSIEVGKNADLVILNQDIMNIEEMNIPKTKVLKTLIMGEVVYESPED